jgi:hypothetical protein
MWTRLPAELELLWLAAIVCLGCDRWSGWRRLRACSRWCIATPARPVWLTGGGVLAICLIVGHWHVPVPAVHDEFAYLLAGDTFAHGRWTNPTHPLWRSLEVPHVIHQPTYQAKYPPLQGLALALGQVLCGRPIVGVWLSYAAACAAMVWMLQDWLPRRWAWLGGLLCAGNPCLTLGWVPSYTGQFGRLHSSGWGQSYWGGAIAMLGGALVFGAATRWAKAGRPRHAACLAVGAAILANSRPYEGAVACCMALLWCAEATPRLIRRDPRRVVLSAAAAAILLAAAAWGMLGYNRAVTGDPWKLPYQVWKETYSQGGLATTLLWSGVARNENLPRKLLVAWEFFIRAPLLLPLTIGIVQVLRPGPPRLALSACLLTINAVLLQNTQGHPHYLAPAVAPLTALCLCGLRQLSVARTGGWPWGRACVRGTLLVYAGVFAFCAEEYGLRQPVPKRWKWSVDRQQIQHELESQGGRHLVLVRYDDNHPWRFEWTYNRAAIDESPVVWVREQDAAGNAAVRRYFADRECWIVAVDVDAPQLARVEDSAH